MQAERVIVRLSYLFIVCAEILDAEADSFVLFSLIVRAGYVIIKLFNGLPVLALPVRGAKFARPCEFYLAHANHVLAKRVCDVGLAPDNCDDRRGLPRFVPIEIFDALRR